MPNKELSFEEAMKRLEEIVDKMENQDIPLEESLVLYKEGSICARLCRQKLQKAKHDLEIWQNGEARDITAAELEEDRGGPF